MLFAALNKQLMKSIQTFLIFQNEKAGKAIDFYTDIFTDAKVILNEKYTKDGPGTRGVNLQSYYRYQRT